MLVITIISLSIVILILSFLLFFSNKISLPPNLTEFNADLLLEKIKSQISETNYENNQKLIDRFNQFQKSLTNHIHENNEKSTKSLTDFKEKLGISLRNDFNQIRTIMDEKLKDINQKVNENISSNFKKTDETFQKIIERITKIDEAQKKMEDLSKNVISLQDILTDKKTRGTLGEVQLKQILVSAFGENNDKLFKMQYPLSNKTRVDAVIFFPEPTGTLCIDSKFPLENYQKMIKINNTNERNMYTKLFRQDMKKHINDISEKYIIDGETAENAILFIPAEAIFAEIYAYHPDIIDYSHKKHVYVVSPTTLLAVCNTVQIAIKDIEIKKHAQEVKKHLLSLSTEFTRYQDRWTKLSKHIEKANEETKHLDTTTQKIIKRFNQINDGHVSTTEEITHQEDPLLEDQKNDNQERLI